MPRPALRSPPGIPPWRGRTAPGPAPHISCPQRRRRRSPWRSPQLQRGESRQRKHEGDDPDEDHDRGFGPAQLDRKRVGKGKGVSVRVDLGGGRIFKKKKQNITRKNI